MDDVVIPVVMKDRYSLWALFTVVSFSFANCFGQVGIGTTTIENGVEFKVESTDSGVLIPRLALTSRAVVAPLAATPPRGTLIFNTATAGTFPNNVVPGFYYWDNTVWRPIADTGINKTAKFRNNTTNLDLSSDTGDGVGVFADIFNTNDWNEEPTLFEKLSNTQLRVNQSGLYEVTVNLYLRSSNVERYMNIRLNVNGTDVNEPVKALGPEDSGSSNNSFSVNFTQYIILNASDVLRLNCIRDGSNATIVFDAVQTSSLVIKRLR